MVAATHGRAFWILDDLSPLHQYHDGLREKALHLFTPRTTARLLPFISEERVHSTKGKSYMSTLGLLTVYETVTDENGITERVYYESGSNPPKGVIVTYFLQSAESLTLTIHDQSGNEIRSFRSRTDEDDKKDGPFIPANAGSNRFVWDMRSADAVKVKGDDAIAKLTVAGAVVPPGSYQLTLASDDVTESQTVELIANPQMSASDGDLQAQSTLWQQIVDKCSETAAAINQMRDVRDQLDGLHKRVTDSKLASEAKTLSEEVLAIESMLAVPGLEEGWRDVTNTGMRLLETLAALPPVVFLGDYKPTDQAQEVFVELSAEIDTQLTAFQTPQLLENDIAAFNQKAASTIPAVIG